ncbi:MAG: hypothetical protein JXB42_06245, partial [Deltaproteobacteria bacterium]|nr:hypothetical protein [Deltaproteobacteria bacterium]
LLPDDELIIARFDAEYTQMISSRFGDAEAGRYKAMRPLREFVRKNYYPVQAFGMHILFELMRPSAGEELK